MTNAGAVGAIGGHPKGWRGRDAPLLDGAELEVQPRPCVLLSQKPEAEVGQTTNWETRAVLIAMVKQESRQLVLKSIFRPGVRCRQSFCHGGSTEGSEDEFTHPNAEFSYQIWQGAGGSEASSFTEQGGISEQTYKYKDINDRIKSE